MKKIDVIIPVYAGIEETQACIRSAAATVDPGVGGLIVINDASPEPDLSKWLIENSADLNFKLITNNENLGFVATVNKGMSLSDNDVLLLNSDVEVSGDWLVRIRDAAYSRKKVASITPFSNNATICSFPNFCCDNELLLSSSVKALDDHFSKIFSCDDLIEVPTGVGFCMYIRRDCLDDIGLFDVETFGRGYGEENDWCQRAEKQGWANYLQANVFVYHKGGVSFDDEQNPRKARALELLDVRHPDYSGKVQDFLARDPVKELRIEALWKFVAQSSLPKVLQVSHRLGGGVGQHVRELSTFYDGAALNLLLEPFEDGKSVKLSILFSGEELNDAVLFDVDRDYDKLQKLLSEIGIGRLHFHHTMGLHPKVWSLPQDLEVAYDMSVHDYYWVNGNPTLINKEGKFAGDIDVWLLDEVCSHAYPIPVSAEVWRKNHTLFISGAERLIFPSQDVCDRFSVFYSHENRVVAWHPDYLSMSSYPEPQATFQGDAPLKVLVLGALSREKGADLLEQVAGQLKGQGVEFHLLGYGYKKLSGVIDHGAYRNDNAHQLISGISPDVVWFPAQWPETYSYTLSLALELGLPVVVPDIGAFSERVAGRAFSQVVSWNLSQAGWVTFWKKLGEKEAGLGCGNVRVFDKAIEDFYVDTYLVALDSCGGRVSDSSLAFVKAHANNLSKKITFRERVLLVLWGISRLPGISRCVYMVPSRMRRLLKRALSRKQISELLKG